MTGRGHNGGPTLEPGESWRRHCWSRARRDLLGNLPLPVVQKRVRRAAQLGLDYPTYATVRAASGRDLVALLFSSNALRIDKKGDLPTARRDKLALQVDTDRLLAVQPPLDPEGTVRALSLRHGLDIRLAIQAPGLRHSWSESRNRFKSALREARLPGDAVLVVGTTALEREWCEVAGLAGYLDAERFFCDS